MGSAESTGGRPTSSESSQSEEPGALEIGTYYRDPFTGDVFLFKDLPGNDENQPKKDSDDEEDYDDYDEDEEPTLPTPKPPSNHRDNIFDVRSYKKLDDFARSLPLEEAAKDYEHLVDKLCSNCDEDDDMSKVRSLFTWLTNQDVFNLRPSELPPRNSPLDHLLQIQFGTNSRATHSYIFYQLCNAAEIPSVFIRGINKSAAYEVGEPIDKKQMTSSWNAVFLNGDWRLVDAFWASTCLVGKKSDDWKLLENDLGAVHNENEEEDDGEGHAEHYMNEFFFLADPEKLIYTHFPDVPCWQLLEKPWTLKDFAETCYVRERFHEMHISFTDSSTKQCIVKVPDTDYSLDFGLIEQRGNNQVFQYYFFKSGVDDLELDKFVMYEKLGKNLSYRIRFPSKGKYKIQIFGNENGLFNEDDTQLLCSYVFEVDNIKGEVLPLPDNPEIGWGPGSETERAGLRAVTHKKGYIETDDGLVEIRLKTIQELNMLNNILTEGFTDVDLRRYCLIRKEDDEYVVSLRLPQAGEYAVKLHASHSADHQGMLDNVCNYLIQVKQGNDNVEPFPPIVDGTLGNRPAAHQTGALPKMENSGMIRTENGKYELRLKKSVTHNLYCELTHNGLNGAALKRCVSRKEEGDEVVFEVFLPKGGEYGLNVFAKKNDSALAESVHNSYLISSQRIGVSTDVNAADEVHVETQKLVVYEDKTTVRVPTIPHNAVASVHRRLMLHPDTKVTLSRSTEEDEFLVELPEPGDYELILYSETAGIMTKRFVYEIDRVDSTQLMQPETTKIAIMSEEEKERERRREELMKRIHEAMEEGQADALAQAIEDFKDSGLSDPRGVVRKAEEYLQFLILRDKLSAAMASKNIEHLEAAINEAERNNKLAQKLGIQLAMAKRTLESLRRLAKLRHAILNMDQKTIAELKSYSTPPEIVFNVMKATFLLLGNSQADMKEWNQLKILMNKTGKSSLKRRVAEFHVEHLEQTRANKAKLLMDFDLETVRDVSAGAATFFVWAEGLIEEVSNR